MIPIKRIIELWNGFWFTPTSPATICVYRIIYGILIAGYGCIAMPSATFWYGSKGFVTERLVNWWLGSPRVSILLALHPTDFGVQLTLAALIISALLLSIGFCSRFFAVVVWFLLVSFHHRDPFVLNVGDHFLRVAGFIMMLAPSDKMYSVDALIRKRRHPESDEQLQCQPWAQRLLQFQVAAMYCQACWAKLAGQPWWDGSAAYVATHISAFANMPMPIKAVWPYKVISYATLIIEFSMWTLVWIKEFRYWILAAAFLMHLGMEVFMTLPMLVYVFCTALIVFVEPDDMQRFITALRLKLAAKEQVQHV